MNADFDRLFRLAKKTGDTLIILDSETGSHQIIMDIDKYESLLGSSSNKKNSGIKKVGTEHWHAAGAVLDNLYPEFNVAPDDSEDMLSGTGFNSAEDIKLNFEPPQQPKNIEQPAQTDSLKYDPVMQEPRPIPMAEQSEQETDIYNEETLGEEPIFFEEPLA